MKSSIPLRVLILSSSGGGGLIQAANAKEQELREKDPEVMVFRRDTLQDWMGKKFGSFCSNKWNKAQIKGDIRELTFLIFGQIIFDYFSWPVFFLQTLRILFKEGIDRVIDTQPMGTTAILRAIRIYNWRRNLQVSLEKVLVDLPTSKAVHYFYPMKRLTRKDLPFLKLVTIPPLLENGETREEFWQKHCRLPPSNIYYEDFFVRTSFRKLQNKPRTSDPFSFLIRYKSEEELDLLKKSFSRGNLSLKMSGNNEVHFSLSSQVRMITILLGSQPASNATLNYVKKFVQIAREANFSTTSFCLFVFCADHKPGEMTLFRKLAEHISRVKEYPKNLSVIPFSFQNDDVIASLFYRSDLTCTRSGGQTAMELMSVSSGEIWIHSEAKQVAGKKESLSQEDLLSGILTWESANARYLQKERGAKIVTPETFAPQARQLFRLKSSKPSLIGSETG
jgi:UDP-N-acetylglucosamine:LPS N-acetylglucosamine transferase